LLEYPFSWIVAIASCSSSDDEVNKSWTRVHDALVRSLAARLFPMLAHALYSSEAQPAILSMTRKPIRCRRQISSTGASVDLCRPIFIEGRTGNVVEVERVLLGRRENAPKLKKHPSLPQRGFQRY
jgi:hypothetical protein